MSAKGSTPAEGSASNKQNYAHGSPLGNQVNYVSGYSASLLHGIDRSAYRSSLDGDACAGGYDRWVCYELSWLDSAGKPEVAILTLDVPAGSPRIVESKSLKLYLNSLNGSLFETVQELLSTISRDLGQCIGCDVLAELSPVGDYSQQIAKPCDAIADTVLVDTLPVTCNVYQRDARLLKLDDQEVGAQRLVTHVFRSNCPVTNQPDWASVYVDYSGRQINPASFLQYIVSYREHNGFHEQCTEQLYADLYALTGDSNLVVNGRFTRRGGIEINPVRSASKKRYKMSRVNRQ